MKTKRLVCILALSVSLFAAALVLTNCATTTSTAPDGTVTTTKAADPAAVEIIHMTAAEYFAQKRAEREAASVNGDK